MNISKAVVVVLLFAVSAVASTWENVEKREKSMLNDEPDLSIAQAMDKVLKNGGDVSLFVKVNFKADPPSVYQQALNEATTETDRKILFQKIYDGVDNFSISEVRSASHIYVIDMYFADRGYMSGRLIESSSGNLLASYLCVTDGNYVNCH